MSTYLFKRNKYTNDVEISNVQGIVLFKWSLTGNYGRAFTIYALTKVLGEVRTTAVVLRDHTVKADIPDEKFGFYRPPEYNRIDRIGFWAKVKNFFTTKKAR